MSIENEYIEEQESSATTSKPSKAKKSKQKRKEPVKSDSLVSTLRNRFDEKKAKSTIGTILLVTTVFLALSCFSYLLTWKIDQHRVINKGFFDFLFEQNEEPVANWLGKFGSWISHLLIYRWFGLSAFVFPFITLIFGIKLLFNKSILPIGKSTSISLVLMIWSSMFLGFFAKSTSYIGGTFGFQLNDWLILTLGRFGTLIFILGLGYICSLLLFHEEFLSFLRRIGAIKKKSKEEIPSSILAEVKAEDDLAVNNLINEDEIQNDDISERLVFEENLLDEDEEEFISEIIDATEDSETDSIEEETSPLEIDDNDDEFSVVVAEENEDDKQLSEDEVDNHRKEYGDYDPKLDLANYTLPSIDLLKDWGGKSVNVDKSELESNKNKIVETLGNYKIEISKIMATVGPTVTLYEIVPAPGVRISKIKNLEDDIALSLAALGIRIIAPIPGKGTIGIEVPNSKPEMVSMRSLIASKKFQESDFELPVVMGKTITNETFTFDLTKMPHLLVAGATGQGKSVGLNAILISILYKKHPAQVKFVLVDPKKVELTLYNKIERHFLAKLPGEEDAIITDTTKVVATLNSLCIEMDDRYDLLKTAHVRTIKEYNTKFIARKLNPEKGHRYLPYIVVLIDEFADLIMTAGKEVEQPIARIAQLARAVGIHLIVATQRPSVNVITGMIKANFPARIAFRVLSKIDSRTILDASGADQLIGRGDMLISTGQDLVRLQCGFVDTPEVEEICEFIGDQRGYPDALLLPEYVGEAAEGAGSIDDDELDPLFADAARIVVMHQQGSASLLQRKLKLGYNRAGRIVDQLEGLGIIGPFKGSKARDVLYSDENSLDQFLASKGIL